VFDQCRLATTGNHAELLDAGSPCLLDRVLDQWLVNHRQHLLRGGLGGWQKSRAEPGDRQHDFTQWLDHDGSPEFPDRPAAANMAWAPSAIPSRPVRMSRSARLMPASAAIHASNDLIVVTDARSNARRPPRKRKSVNPPRTSQSMLHRHAVLRPP